MIRLLIVQPYVPSYRVPLFEGMRKTLGEAGIEMAVAAGMPQGEAGLRRDRATDSGPDFVLSERRLAFASRSVNVRRLGSALDAFCPDFVIVEQAIKNLETYPVLARHLARRGPRLAMWGQGRSYSTRQSAIESEIKQWVTRRCDWFFAYTEGGAVYVKSHGFDASRVTVLNNTIDTAQLSAELAAVTAKELGAFLVRLGLTTGRVGLFLGGVDQHKGIDFLLESAVLIEQALPGFVLLIGGSGAQANRVQLLEARGGPVRYLGRIDGHDKALALKAAEVLLIPEWVGLVAVDSLVAGRPIITTQHPSHSPEFEYLVPDSNCVVTPHERPVHALQVAELLRSPLRIRELQEKALLDSQRFSMEAMVDRFVDGILRWRATCMDPSASP
jgi:glycosyltransferase involved in cell wall biosynthesis